MGNLPFMIGKEKLSRTISLMTIEHVWLTIVRNCFLCVYDRILQPSIVRGVPYTQSRVLKSGFQTYLMTLGRLSFLNDDSNLDPIYTEHVKKPTG